MDGLTIAERHDPKNIGASIVQLNAAPQPDPAVGLIGAADPLSNRLLKPFIPQVRPLATDLLVE